MGLTVLMVFIGHLRAPENILKDVALREQVIDYSSNRSECINICISQIFIIIHTLYDINT